MMRRISSSAVLASRSTDGGRSWSAPATLIADGVRATWDETRLREALASFLDRHVVPATTPELRFQEVSLDEEEQSFGQ